MTARRTQNCFHGYKGKTKQATMALTLVPSYELMKTRAHLFKGPLNSVPLSSLSMEKLIVKPRIKSGKKAKKLLAWRQSQQLLADRSVPISALCCRTSRSRHNWEGCSSEKLITQVHSWARKFEGCRNRRLSECCDLHALKGFLKSQLENLLQVRKELGGQHRGSFRHDSSLN